METSVEASIPGRALEGAGQPTPATLEELYDTHSGTALAVAYRVLGNVADAEEVLQEVFLTVWRSRHSYDSSRGSLRTWLLAVVRHRAIDVLRRRPHVAVCPLDEHFHAAGEGDVPAEVVRTLDGQRMRRALQGLPPEQLQAIELAYFSGLTHGEIAERLAIPLGTIKGRIRLGMDRLRTSLGAGLEQLVGQGEQDERRRPLAHEHGGVLLAEQAEQGRKRDAAQRGPQVALGRDPLHHP